MLDLHNTSAPAFSIAADGDDFIFTDLNAAYVLASGIPATEQIGKRPQDCFDAPLAEKVVAHYRRCLASDTPVSYEAEYVMPSGYVCWRTTLLPFRPASEGGAACLLGFCVIVTAEKMIERSINAFHENLALAVGAIDGGFWIYDVATGELETSRPLAELIAGPGHATLSLAEYVGFVHADDLGRGLATITDESCDYRVISHDGHTRWLRSKRRVVRDTSGNPTKIVGLVLEVTEQKAALRVLASEATTDGLTRLKDRRAFDRIAARRFRESRASGSPLGVVIVDVGARIEDAILRKVARKICRLTGETDTLARFGAGAFAVLTARGDLGGLASRAAAILARPVRADDGVVQLDVKIGAASRAERDRSVQALLARAESALRVDALQVDALQVGALQVGALQVDAPDRLTA